MAARPGRPMRQHVDERRARRNPRQDMAERSAGVMGTACGCAIFQRERPLNSFRHKRTRCAPRRRHGQPCEERYDAASIAMRTRDAGTGNQGRDHHGQPVRLAHDARSRTDSG
ncbi:hypothetical protein AL037_16115 [Salipiger aestuarii]|nr:hypothetical protein AL037_16115 [Salipiger aestuarii]